MGLVGELGLAVLVESGGSVGVRSGASAGVGAGCGRLRRGAAGWRGGGGGGGVGGIGGGGGGEVGGEGGSGSGVRKAEARGGGVGYEEWGYRQVELVGQAGGEEITKDPRAAFDE